MAVLAQMRSTLPIVTGALQRWRRVSGLVLEASKCVLMPLRGSGVEELGAYLRDELDIGDARVATAARYLGATVGTDTRGQQWDAVAAKLQDRESDVVACGVSPPMWLQRFNIHCGGMVRYHAQFVAPERQRTGQRRTRRVQRRGWPSLQPSFMAQIY